MRRNTTFPPGLFVVDARKVVGIVTFEQLRGRGDAEVVRDFMTGCLPVIDGGKLTGIITTSDLRRAVSGDDTMR